MRTLTIDTQACRTSIVRAFSAAPGEKLTKSQVAEARVVCSLCPGLSTCRDFAYVTGMPGFVAGTTDAERADVRAMAEQYLARQRAAARQRGVPFTHVERDRIHASALRAAHLTKVLGS